MGNPNSGKTLLFNQLTGLKRKVANFPGVTVEITSGSYFEDPELEIVDFPGVYSLHPLTQDEKIAVENFDKFIHHDQITAVVCVLDATRLQRSLYLAFQVIEKCRQNNKAVFVALNMMDEIILRKIDLRIEKIEEALGVKTIGVSARRSLGFADFKELATQAKNNPENLHAKLSFEGSVASLKDKAKKIESELFPNISLILKSQNRLDRLFLSNWLGGALFLLTMLFLFQSIFTWATPMIDFIDMCISTTGSWVVERLPEGFVSHFVEDALFGGVGSFLVFVPQIAVLTLIIGFLEDSGYLVRAAIICHKPLSFFGLSGKSFIPLLSGHACAIPAIFASRTIESPLKRKITMAVLPLMSCSARLPVYGLFVAVLIPSGGFFGGLVGYQGLAFLACYLTGIVVALLISAMLSKWAKNTPDDVPFVLELPPYRWPHWKPLWRKVSSDSWAFIQKAGGVIFAVTMVIWFLGYFPNGADHLDTSFLSYLGKAIEPVLSPLGLDWKFGVAILTSFLAREVFVGTLGTLYGLENAEDDIVGLTQTLHDHQLSLAAGLALLMFFVIAPQCISTLAVLKKETGGWKMPIQIFVGYTILAYALALMVYHLVPLL